MQEHVLVSYRQPMNESHVRNADGSWSTTFGSSGETWELRSVGARTAVDALYLGMHAAQGRMVLPG